MSHRWMIFLFVALMVCATIGQKEQNPNDPNSPQKSEDSVKKIARIIQKYILNPVRWIAATIRSISQKVLERLDKGMDTVFVTVWKVVMNIFHVVVMLPLKGLEALSRIAPGLAGDDVQNLTATMGGCNDKAEESMNTIQNATEDLKVCLKDPLVSIYSKQINVSVMMDQLLDVVNNTAKKLAESDDSNKMETLMDAGSTLMDTALPKVSDIIKASQDIAAEVPKLAQCLVGNEGKGVVTKSLEAILGYVTCLNGMTGGGGGENPPPNPPGPDGSESTADIPPSSDTIPPPPSASAETGRK